jgi:hypothetical protein
MFVTGPMTTVPVRKPNTACLLDILNVRDSER